MRPAFVVEDSDAAKRERERRHEDTRRLLARSEPQEDREPSFGSITSALSWYFAMAGHVASVSAIDPAADFTSGGRKSCRLERAWRIQSVRQALDALRKAQGNDLGARLLWLHLRPRLVTGKRRVRGVEVAVWEDPVPVWELYRDPVAKRHGLSQRAAHRLYVSSLAACESFALERGWLVARAPRRVVNE